MPNIASADVIAINEMVESDRLRFPRLRTTTTTTGEPIRHR
jgi:hypothetical protein